MLIGSKRKRGAATYYLNAVDRSAVDQEFAYMFSTFSSFLCVSVALNFCISATGKAR